MVILDPPPRVGKSGGVGYLFLVGTPLRAQLLTWKKYSKQITVILPQIRHILSDFDSFLLYFDKKKTESTIKQNKKLKEIKKLNVNNNNLENNINLEKTNINNNIDKISNSISKQEKIVENFNLELLNIKDYINKIQNDYNYKLISLFGLNIIFTSILLFLK